MFKAPNLGETVKNPNTLTQLLQTTFNQIEEELKKADPVGREVVWAGMEIPSGWLECDGSSYNMTRYPELYHTIGTTFGGTATTFKVPDRTADYPVDHIIIIRAE